MRTFYELTLECVSVLLGEWFVAMVMMMTTGVVLLLHGCFESRFLFVDGIRFRSSIH